MSAQSSASKPRCAACGKTAAFRCTGCNQERYCSAKCQKEHWFAGHKAVCKRTERKGLEASATSSPSSSSSSSPPRAPALDAMALAHQSKPSHPHPPCAQGPSPLHSQPQAPEPSTSATTHRTHPPSAPTPVPPSTQPSTPAPRRRLPQQLPPSTSATQNTLKAPATKTNATSNTPATVWGDSSACTSNPALSSHPLLNDSLSSTSSLPPDSPAASPAAASSPTAASANNAADVGAPALGHDRPAVSSSVTPLPRESSLSHNQPPAPQLQQEAPTGPMSDASCTHSPQPPRIRGRVPNHALPMTPQPPPGPPPPRNTRQNSQQPHHAQPPLAGSSAPLNPTAAAPQPPSAISSSTTTSSAPRSTSPSLRRGFLNSRAVAVTSAPSPSSPASAAPSPSAAPAVPAATAAATPGSSSGSRDSSPLRRGFLNAPPKRAAATRAQRAGTSGGSRSILEDLPANTQQGTPSSLPAADPAPPAMHGKAQYQLGPLCTNPTQDAADAQDSASAVRAELPPMVHKGRGWGVGWGTHVSALNQDVMWEVLRRLPPRALLMAGMTCRAWQQLALADSLWGPLFEPCIGTPPPAWLTRPSITRTVTNSSTNSISNRDVAQQPSLLEQQAPASMESGMAITGDVRQQRSEAKHQHVAPPAAPRMPQPPSARPFLVSGIRGAMALRSQQQQQQQVDSSASSQRSGSGRPSLRRTGSGNASRAARANSLVSHPVEGLDEVSDAAESPRSPAAKLPAGGRPTKLPALPPGCMLPRPPLYQVLGYELRLRRNWRTGRYATHSLREHTGNVECLELVDTAVFGRTLVSCAWDGAVHVYALPSCNHHPALKLRELRRPVVGQGPELRSPRCVRRWTQGHTGWITSMAAGRHYVVTVGVDRRMAVHAYSDEGSHPGFVAPHPAELTCVRFAYRGSGCETMVVTGSKDGSILLWDIASKQLLHKYQGAQDVVWSLLALPLSALPIPNNPIPLDNSISARWLYDSVRTTAHHEKHEAGGRAGARRAADKLGGVEGEGGDGARVFYGSSFVSTSRDGRVLLWALPPLLRRRMKGDSTRIAAPRPSTWELHATGGRCSEDGECCGGSASSGGRSGPAWEFCALVQPFSRPTPPSNTPAGTPGGQNGIQGGAGGGPMGASAAAAPAATSQGTVPRLQPTSMPHPPPPSCTPAGVSRSRGGAASTRHELGKNTFTDSRSEHRLLPPTLPASPLLELSGGSSAVLTADVWLPDTNSMQEWARKEGLVGMLATGAADGTVKVWRICGVRLVQSGQQHQLRHPPSHAHPNNSSEHQQQQQQQEQGGCMVLTQHQSGVMSIKFGLMPLAAAGARTSRNSRGSTLHTGGVDDPRERRLVVITGLMEAVKVWDPISGGCLCQIDHPSQPMGVANLCAFPDFLVTLALVDGLLAYHCTGLQAEHGASGSKTGASTSISSPQPLQVQPVHGLPFRAILSMTDPCQSPSAALACGPGAIAVGSGTGDVTLIDFGG